MFRQLSRHSLRPVSRSCPSRMPHTVRTYHTHSFKRSPRSPAHRHSRPHVPIQTSSALLQLSQPCCQSRHHPSHSHSFHSTRIAQGPLLGFLVAFKVRLWFVRGSRQRQMTSFDPFQSSAMLEVIRTAGRVALTFIPVLLVKNHASRKLLKRIEVVKQESGDGALPRSVKEFIGKQANLLRNIRRRTILFHALVFTPCILFWAAVIASLERTPLTGR